MNVISVPKPMLVDEELGRTSSQLIPTYNQPRPASFLPSLAALSRPQFPTFDPTKVRNASSIEAIPKNFTQTAQGTDLPHLQSFRRDGKVQQSHLDCLSVTVASQLTAAGKGQFQPTGKGSGFKMFQDISSILSPRDGRSNCHALTDVSGE